MTKRRERSPKPSSPTLPIGKSGLPSLSMLDAEGTSTHQTETTQSAPVSARRSVQAVVTVVIGFDAGRPFVLDGAETVLGRGAGCHVILAEPGVSRRHARILRRGEHFVVEDLDSKNGTFVSGKKISRQAMLVAGDELQLGPNVSMTFALLGETEGKLALELYESSMRDALTHAFNRRYFLDRFQTEIAFATRHDARLSVLALDLDHFKALNDTHGHLAGDEALKHVTLVIQRTLRHEDVLARIGGEEFAILLRGISGPEGITCAERVRSAVSAHPFAWEQENIPITVSVGAAAIDECKGKVTTQRLLEIADRRLYRAKKKGRNQVCGSG